MAEAAANAIRNITGAGPSLHTVAAELRLGATEHDVKKTRLEAKEEAEYRDKAVRTWCEGRFAQVEKAQRALQEGQTKTQSAVEAIGKRQEEAEKQANPQEQKADANIAVIMESLKAIQAGIAPQGPGGSKRPAGAQAEPQDGNGMHTG